MSPDCTPVSRLRYSAEHAGQIADGLEADARKLEEELAKLRKDIPMWRQKAKDFLAAAEQLKTERHLYTFVSDRRFTLGY